MAVWFVIPSAKPARDAQDCINEWRRMGYKVAVWRDADAQPVEADFAIYAPYPGYAQAVNTLAHTVLDMDPGCQWVVTGGDDVFPDQNKHPEQIARECSRRFGKGDIASHGDAEDLFGTYGVMQPIGDAWGGIERICGSPWMGRDWCLQANRGCGPLHPDFFHMFVDEFLQESAKLQGCFWQRKDLRHEHRHWGREGRPMPSYLVKVNSKRHWDESLALFNRHRATRFAESYPA